MVKDLDTIFGVSTVLLKNQGKRYKFGLFIGILLDVFVMSLAVIKILMDGNSVTASMNNASVYIIVCIIAALISNMAVSNIIKTEYKEAYNFYNKFKKYKTSIMNFKVDDKSMFSVLFCSGYQRTKPDCTLDTYKESFKSACCQSRKYSKGIMKRLSLYEDSESGNLSVYVVKKGSKLYFVDFVD